MKYGKIEMLIGTQRINRIIMEFKSGIRLVKDGEC